MGMFLPVRRSYLDRVPAGLKLTLSATWGTLLVAFSDPWVPLVGSAFAIFLHALARVAPWRTVIETWHVLPFLVALAAVHGLSHGVFKSAVLFWRLCLLLWITHLLARCTSSKETIEVMERIFRVLPLRPLGLSSRDLAIMFMMSVRFFFFFRQEIATLRKAQKARAFHLKGRSLREKSRLLLSVAMNLLDCASRLSNRVTLALMAKAYMPGPSPYHLARKPGYELRPYGANDDPQHEAYGKG